MRKTLPCFSWVFNTVEWSPTLSKILQAQKLNATHFVLPDLPGVYSAEDREEYFSTIPRNQRIQTLAASRYTDESSICADIRANKVLIVGGNGKSAGKFSTIEVAKILRNEMDVEVWGVTNPNSKESIRTVEQKIDSGITGFLTQPLLSSHAIDVLESYPKSMHGGFDITYIAGLAMPQTNRDLYFWLKLLEQPELERDALFKSHMTFFQSPYNTPLAWAKREILDIQLRTNVDGIHFMPLKNTNGLIEMLRA